MKGYPVCRFHGARGGAKTERGRFLQKMASWKHGYYSKEEIEERRMFKEKLREYKEAIHGI